MLGKSYTIEEANALLAKAYSLKDFQTALTISTLILAHFNHDAYAHCNHGTILHSIGRYDDALASYDIGIRIKPDNAEAYNSRGITLKYLKRYEEALANYDSSIKLNPSFAEAYNNRGIVLEQMKRYVEAIANYDRAIALKPDYAEAYNNRGVTQEEMKRYEDALASYERAIALNPDMPNLLGVLSKIKTLLCDWQGITSLFEELAKKIESDQPASSPFNLQNTPLSATHKRLCAELFVKRKYPPRAAPLSNGERYAHDRIRVGYFSSDLHGSHPMPRLLAEFFELHNRSTFEVTAFSFGPQTNDAMRNRLENAFDHFIDVRDNSEQEIAALARRMEIDIAVDLNGFTRNARPGIFAMRPAPVQISYMGYPGTMGASYIDYLIADPIVIPFEHERFYTEQIVRLPHTYWVLDSTRGISQKHFTRQELGLPQDKFVFCCFNQNYKITPDVFDVWMNLLRKVDGSVLWLLKGNETAARNLRAEATARGIEEHRLVFAEPHAVGRAFGPTQTCRFVPGHILL